MDELKKHLQNGELELAKLNSKNQPVEMEIQQLQSKANRHNKYGSIRQKISHLSWDQKYEWVNYKRLRANEIFKKGNVDQAIELYLEAMIGIDLKDENSNRLDRVHHELKYPILLNLATCSYKKKQYQKGIQICNTILEQQRGKNNINAFYKKAYCKVYLGQFEQARKLISICNNLIKNQNEEKSTINTTKITLQDLKKLIVIIKQTTKSQKKMYQKIFASNDDLDEEEDNLLGKDKEEQILVYSQSIPEKISKCCSNVTDCLTGTFFGLLNFSYEQMDNYKYD